MQVDLFDSLVRVRIVKRAQAAQRHPAPHVAWTTKEALQRLMDITARNLRTWLEGSGEHIVNG